MFSSQVLLLESLTDEERDLLKHTGYGFNILKKLEMQQLVRGVGNSMTSSYFDAGQSSADRDRWAAHNRLDGRTCRVFDLTFVNIQTEAFGASQVSNTAVVLSYTLL